MAIQNAFPKDEKQVVDSALSTTSTNPVQNAIITSNINSINTTLSSKANTSDVLTKTNTIAFTPTANYHPATKAYVDSKAGGSSNRKLILSAQASQTVYNDAPLQIISGMDCTKDYEIEFNAYKSSSSYACMPLLGFSGTYDGITASTRYFVNSTSVDTPLMQEDDITYSDTHISISRYAETNFGLLHFSIKLYGHETYDSGNYKYKGYGIRGTVINAVNPSWDTTTDIIGNIYTKKDSSYSSDPSFSVNVTIEADPASYNKYRTEIQNLRVYEIS